MKLSSRGYRISLSHLPVYVSAFVVFSLVWSQWQHSRDRRHALRRDAWHFDVDVHANVHTLTNEQCDIAFPRLYHSLEQSGQKRHLRKITEKEIRIKQGRCMLRVMIYEGELFIIDAGQPEQCYVDHGNERERILGTLAQIDRSLSTSPTTDPPIPNIEFSLSLDDLPRRSKPDGAFFGYTRRATPDYDDIWLMPNYAYWSWNYTHAPSWNSLRREILALETDLPWSQKDPRVVWRGKPNMASLRADLLRVSHNKTWSDIKPVVINDASDAHARDVLHPRDFCGYKFTVQTEGTSYSGRLKLLQLCRSALITHPLQWQEFHTHLMELSGPNINFIEASERFGNLESAMEYFEERDGEAEEIARNGYEVFARRYLTPAAVTCYWRRLFWTWASVQGFRPQLYGREGDGKQVMRGTPWTAFAANWPQDPSVIP